MGSDERPTGTTRQKGKRQNPMDKGQTGLVSGMVHQCKFCEKVCTSESGLTNHINNVHQERQNISGVANVAANITFSTCILNI